MFFLFFHYTQYRITWRTLDVHNIIFALRLSRVHSANRLHMNLSRRWVCGYVGVEIRDCESITRVTV